MEIYRRISLSLIKRKTSVILLLIGLLLGAVLLVHNYKVYPQRGATSDEYTYSFLGISLLTVHKPISWSYFPAYKNRKDLVIDKIFFPIVQPYFDHPPLFGFVVGTWAMVFGENTFQKVDLSVIRLLPIVLSFISSVLLYFIAEKLYGRKTAFWALLIFSTVTVFVINRRVVVSENFLTVLFLSVLLLFIQWKENMTRKKALFLGLLCGCAFLSKILGIAAILFVLYFFIDSRQKYKNIVFLIFGFLICVFVLFVYGFAFGKDLFLQIQFAQSSRTIGPSEFWYILSTPIIINTIYKDPWYFFGFFSFFLSFFEYVKNKFLIVPAFVYFLLLLLTLTEAGQSGWYIIPLFPFLSLAIAHVLSLSMKKISFIPLLFVMAIGLTQFHLFFDTSFGGSTLFYRSFVLIMLLPFLFVILLKNEFLYRILANFWFYIFILGNILITYNYIHPA